MQAILENLRQLGRTRLIALAAVGAGLFGVLLFGLNTVMAPSFTPIYRDLSPGAAGQIVETLEQDGFRVRLEAGGSVVSVPVEDVPRARMALADKGLPADGTPGWELFDETSGLGMNTFLQRVNRLRALEGELARSIQTIDGIDAARVHVVLPEREAFSRDRPQPSASVIVRGRASHQIDLRQAQTIRALVASAVPDLAPGRVTVLSASGETILSEDSGSTADVTLQSVRAGIEDRLARSINEILTARVGAGNARVKVSVDLTTERQVIRAQSYDPAQRVVRSTETREESREDQRIARGEVGVIDDLPGALGDVAQPPSNSNRTNSTSEIVNYEIGSTESETVREPGEIVRVSVAVLVNGIYNVADDGTVSYEERPAEELARLEQLVRSAIGYDEARADSVSVDSLRFMDYSMDVGEPVGRSLRQMLSDNLMSILRGLFALAIVGLLLAFGFVPLLRRVSLDNSGPEIPKLEEPPKAAALPRAPAPGALADGRIGRPAGALPPRPAPAGLSGTVMGPPGGHPDDLVTVGAVKGGIQRGWINSVSDLIEREPDDALKVVKSWLAEGT